jgi:large subunit ribosomal protein L22
MSKDKNPRRVADNEAMAKTRMLRTSPQKLNLLAQMIRGRKVNKALTDLTFSKKRIADDVKKCLQSAIANAENNHNLDVDELVVAEAYVGKNLIMKRGRPRARGRFGKIIKPFSELTILVRQVEEQAEWDIKLIQSECASRSTVLGIAAGTQTPKIMAICCLRT